MHMQIFLHRPMAGVPREEDMATHSGTLAWRIPWTEEPGGLQSTGSQRVGHDCSDLACTHVVVVVVGFGGALGRGPLFY